jgi:NADH:ubiquinone oxidoreductase subunit 6 (subunit J)
MAYAYLIIYFGAVIMLFVFIVMLLDVNIVYDRLEFYANIPTLFLFFIFVKLSFFFHQVILTYGIETVGTIE